MALMGFLWNSISSLINQVFSKAEDHSKPYAMHYRHERYPKLTQGCQKTGKSSPKYQCPGPPISSQYSNRLPFHKLVKILYGFLMHQNFYIKNYKELV